MRISGTEPSSVILKLFFEIQTLIFELQRMQFKLLKFQY